LWVSIGKGELHKQSKKSLDRIFDGFPSVNLLEQEFFGSRTYIEQNEVVVVNWEKIRSKNRSTGEEFIAAAKTTLIEGKMAKKTAQIVKKELEKVIEPLHVLQVLRKYGRIQMDINKQNNNKLQKREVILSGYITNS